MSFIKELIEDEGLHLDIYKDPKGLLTGGIGHLMTEEDLKLFNPKWNDKEKLSYWVDIFIKDLSAATYDVTNLVKNFLAKPNQAQIEVLINMRFNLGLKGLKGFKKMLIHLSNGDKDRAADEMIDSKWHKDFVLWNSGVDSEILRSRRMEKKMRNS